MAQQNYDDKVERAVERTLSKLQVMEMPDKESVTLGGNKQRYIPTTRIRKEVNGYDCKGSDSMLAYFNLLVRLKEAQKNLPSAINLNDVAKRYPVKTA